MQLQEIMSTRVASACPEDSLGAAQERMRRTGIHHLVVVDRHKVVGVLTDCEATRRLNEGASTVETAMFMLPFWLWRPVNGRTRRGVPPGKACGC